MSSRTNSPVLPPWQIMSNEIFVFPSACNFDSETEAMTLAEELGITIRYASTSQEEQYLHDLQRRMDRG